MEKCNCRGCAKGMNQGKKKGFWSKVGIVTIGIIILFAFGLVGRMDRNIEMMDTNYLACTTPLEINACY